jgi:DeoR family fructose operon transcriptional repressor
MHATERKRFILNSLSTADSISVQELIDHCKVSAVTIRRDLTELERRGLIARSYGRIHRLQSVDHLIAFDARANLMVKEKNELCRRAASFIRAGDILFVDCGTTMSYLAQYIRDIPNLHVITNSLPLMSALIDAKGIRVNLIGGEVDPDRKAVYGPVAERQIADYHADKAFIGADGVSTKNGLSSDHERESAVTRRMMQSADSVFLLCDHSKLEKDSYIRFADLSAIDCLVTDSGADREVLSRYEAQKITVVTA